MSEEALLIADCLLETGSLSRSQERALTEVREATYLSSRSKRMLDVTGALLLLSLVLPLLALVSVIIVVTSRGGSMFRQCRYGRYKTPFVIYKLRSMRCSNNASFRQAVRGDARVTWIGRIIRKTSIDELPQLLNVIKGEMSLVGPRPHPIELDDKFASEIGSYNDRFKALPGMTGLAQISGSRGGTPTTDHMRRRIAFDVRYTREASLTLDIKILLLTFKELIFALSDENAF